MTSSDSNNDPVSKTILATLVGGLLAICAGVVTQYYASQFQFSSQLHIQKIQTQRQVFARIMGRKFATTQLYVSRYEALIFSDYHESRLKRVGTHSPTEDQMDLQETQRWMHRSEDLVFEIIKNNQSLNEDLGTISSVFPDTPQLRELVQKIHSFKAIKTPQPPSTTSVDELHRWKIENVRQVQELVDHEYGGPIDELLAYLSKHLPTD